MAKTALQYIERIEQAVRSRMDPRLDPLDVVNEAGRHLAAMQSWNWMVRPPASLNFAANTNYVALPTDFGGIIHLAPTNSLTRTVHTVTLDVIQDMRADASIAPLDYYVAVEFPTQVDTTTAPAGPRLAIYPTPAANETGALTLTYHAAWSELATVTAIPNIPLDVEALLVALVRAFATGYMQEAAGDVSQRLALIEQSPLYIRLIERYALMQPHLGQNQGGQLAGDEGEIYRPYTTIGGRGQ